MNTTAVQLKLLKSGVALVTLDLPGEKMNLLSESLMRELNDVLDQVASNKTVKGLIIASGKADNFVAGANVREIQHLQSQPASEAYKGAQLGKSIMAKIEALPFNTVCAINGICLGGGTEMSLACKYRIASTDKKTKIGLPEVMLGFLPGWGGTIRLPRLIGIQEALTLITTGAQVDARKAWKLGLVDETVDAADLLKRAEEIALSGGAKRFSKPLKAKAMALALEGNPLGRAVLANMAGKMVAAKSKGYIAPNEIVKVIFKSYKQSREAAFENESRAFAKLATSSVSRNLVGLFFAEGESKKMPEGVRPSIEIKTVGVLGAGVMGAGIAQAAAYSGYKVILKDIKPEFLEKGMATIKGLFDGLVERRKMTREEADAIVANIKPTTNYADMSDCDLVIEAVLERMDVKKSCLAELDKVISKPYIFATNTSSLSVSEMAVGCAHPENVVGLHFFNPVHKMPLVEVVRGATTSDTTLATSKAFAMKLGKKTVTTGDAPGFVVNRILAPYMLEAIRLLENGTPPQDIEKAMTTFGMPMGPLALLDEVGLDIAAHVVDTLYGALGERMAPPAILADIKKLKLLGKKGGKGIYLYDANGKRVFDKKTKSYVFNPEVLACVKGSKAPKQKGEVQDRLVYAMISEAARCLEEGVVTEASQVDFAMVFGTGFAPFTGGPLRYADSQGIRIVQQKLQHLQAAAGENYRPAGSLAEKAMRGESFYR
jgi:3-hydroxyacyl-CoA dehydrogenase/enoyl-CoA hydratase/3-hydroxybutyryl-CoA epimerase